EFSETRLSRNPPDTEKTVLAKIKNALEGEKTVRAVGLGAGELQVVAAPQFYTDKPVIIAETNELQNPDALMVRAFQESGYICFLTVGGKENRAWPLRNGATAWEAAGSIHTDIQKG